MLGLPKKNRNKKGLALTPEPTLSPSSGSSHSSQSSPQAFPSSANSSSSLSNVLASSSDSKNSYHTTLEQQLATLELARADGGRQGEKMELRDGDLEVVQELGSGNGGVVSHCRHKRTGIDMAKKVVHIATSPATRKQILRELQILHDCSSPYIVSFYGAYLAEPSIAMCMEFMDKGSLDTIYKKVGPIAEPILSQIAFAIVSGLTYLYEVHKIMHRDVKPSNVLLNSAGEIKICDFGVSGELINSVADTFVGTSTYMSPERISGDPYTVKSDVWSLGITIVELAIGRFPFSASALDDEDDSSDNDAESSAGEFKGNDEIFFGGNEIDGSSRGERPSRVGSGSGSGSNGRAYDLAGEEGEDTLSPVKPHKKSESVEAAEKRRLEKRASRIASSPLISNTIVDPASSSTITSLPSSTTTAPKKKSTKATGVSLSGGSNQMSILELLQYIVNEPSPTLPTALRHPTTGERIVFSPSMRVFVESCLRKEPVAFQGGGRRKKKEVEVEVVAERRPVPRELLNYEWMKQSKIANTDVKAFAKSIP